jgi:pyridoxal phosphate enzyme (YggS family)
VTIKENIERLKARINEVAVKADRNPDVITIVAVAKTVSTAKIQEAIANGIRIIGENRVQEARQKYAIIGDKIDWHMVGHLQTNKVKEAVKIFRMIQSLDSLRLAEEIEKRANAQIDCLIEVNTSKEASKFGLAPQEVFDFYDNIKKFKKVNVVGLMTIGPGWAIDDPEASRPCFQMLHDLRDELAQECDRPLPVLSMGMTSDYEVAIEEGSNMVRIGTAIFGPRT